jgi:hypothetical protein
MPEEKNKIGPWFFPSIVFNTLLGITPYLVPIALVIIPAYLVGYHQLTVQYKLMVVLSFLLVGLTGNIIFVVQNKKDALYQLAWSLYLGSIIGFVGLLSNIENIGDEHRLLIRGIFYGSYLLGVFALNGFFQLHFQFYSKSKPRASAVASAKVGVGFWQFLYMLFMVILGLYAFYKFYCLGLNLPQCLIPRDAFVFVYPDKQVSQFIWPGFFGLGGIFAAIPVFLIYVNLAEGFYVLVLNFFGAETDPNEWKKFKNANGGLIRLVKWMTLPLLPLMLFGLLRFYYFDPSGVHLYHWPMKTTDYSWKSIQSVHMKAWGDGETEYGYHMSYDLFLRNGEEFEICWQCFDGTTDRQVAESYLKLSRAIRGISSVSVSSNVSRGGQEFINRELGNEAKDILLKQ